MNRSNSMTRLLITGGRVICPAQGLDRVTNVLIENGRIAALDANASGDAEIIDAAGILLLLDAHRRAMRDGGMVALRSPSARARRNLKLAKVDRVLQVISADGNLTLGEIPRREMAP